MMDTNDTASGKRQILNFLIKIIALLSSALDSLDSAIVQFLTRSFLEPIAVTE